MIHRFERREVASPEKPRWGLRLLVAAGLGSIAALLAWWCSDSSPALFFCIGAGFCLTCLRQFDIEMKYYPPSRAGNTLEERCNEWRITRRGVLLYRDDKQGCCLFLPWENLQEASEGEEGILLWNEETDTFFCLPVEPADRDALLQLAQARIKRHKKLRKEPVAYEKQVFLTGAPFDIPLCPFLLTALPWFLLGLATPFLFPAHEGACLFIFVLGASAATTGHYELEENFEMAAYVGEEVRRTRRGLVARSEEGFTSFIPWAAMEEGTITAADSVFLRLRGKPYGIVLTHKDTPLPVPIIRRYTKIHRWMRHIARFALIVSSAALGAVWLALAN